jgi:hypothetical protein
MFSRCFKFFKRIEVQVLILKTKIEVAFLFLPFGLMPKKIIYKDVFDINSTAALQEASLQIFV